MFKKYFSYLFLLTILIGSGASNFSCITGVEPSPEPGIFRVTLQSNPADSFIVIQMDTLTVSKNDWFVVTIYQGFIAKFK